jgi:archaemetzincin
LDKPSIIIINFGNFEQDVINWIAEDISRSFHYPVKVLANNSDLSIYYSPGRRQYDANGILQIVSGMRPPNAVKTIGLLKVDLFIPILTYLFGQAVLNGDTAIASIYRLRNELYGLKQIYILQIERLRKVVIHELGHTFGLIHCLNPVCVMRSSTYVEDIDQKGIYFCAGCQAELNMKIPSVFTLRILR